jgi:hypothetical protein
LHLCGYITTFVIWVQVNTVARLVVPVSAVLEGCGRGLPRTHPDLHCHFRAGLFGISLGTKSTFRSIRAEKRTRPLRYQIDMEPLGEKVARLKLPSGLSARTALIYCGEPDPEIARSGYFHHLVPATALFE